MPATLDTPVPDAPYIVGHGRAAAAPPAFNNGKTPSPKLTAALEAFAKPAPGEARTRTEEGSSASASPASPPASPSTAPTEQPKRFVVPDDEQAAATNEPPAAPPAAEPEHFKEPKQLREAYDKLKSEFQSARSTGELTAKELETLRGEVAKAKERLQALEPLEPKVKEYEQRLSTTEERLRIADYTQSEEFHNAHTKPLAEASASAERWIGQLNVRTQDGQSRKASSQDFKALLGLDYGTAFEAAKEMFGPEVAGRVMGHYERVQDLLLQRDDALKNAALRSQEWTKQRAEKQTQSAMERRTKFQRVSQELATKHKDLYLPPEDDAEAREVYQTGAQLADLAIEPDPSMTEDEVMAVVAKTRHRAAAMPMLLLMNKRKDAEIGQLKARLAAYEKSEPGGKSPSGATGTGTETRGRDLRSQMRADLEKVATRR